MLTKQAFVVLKALCGNDEVKRAIVLSGAIEFTVQGLTSHPRHAGVAESGCAALATMALRVPENCAKIVLSNGTEAIIKAMQIHPDVIGVQVSLSYLYNLLERTQ